LLSLVIPGQGISCSNVKLHLSTGEMEHEFIRCDSISSYEVSNNLNYLTVQQNNATIEIYGIVPPVNDTGYIVIFGDSSDSGQVQIIEALRVPVIINNGTPTQTPTPEVTVTVQDTISAPVTDTPCPVVTEEKKKDKPIPSMDYAPLIGLGLLFIAIGGGCYYAGRWSYNNEVNKGDIERRL